MDYMNLQLENLDNEVWKDCATFEMQYQVSNLARVKSLERNNPYNGSLMPSRILKQYRASFKHRGGQSLKIALCRDGIRYTFNVAVLVGETFVGKSDRKHYFKKKNGIWNDCRAENLELIYVKNTERHIDSVVKEIWNIEDYPSNQGAIKSQVRSLQGLSLE